MAIAAALHANLADMHVAVCPQCGAQCPFERNLVPNIDACGFESYRFDCEACGTPLAGIVDPADDLLLLSEISA
jgi:hypothetical protein